MARWTDDQQAVIDSKGTDLLVSAAAGSGKTAVMIARIMRMLEAGGDIETFLIVTFTKAAAGEMRERLQRAIDARLTELASEDSGNHLREQLFKLGNAQITTIHSFCSDVLSQYFYLLDLAPDMKVGEEAMMVALKTEALDDVLEGLYETEDPEFLDFCDTLGADRDDSRLRSVVEQLYGFAMSKSNPREWLAESVERYGEDLESSPYAKVILEKLNDDLDECIQTLNEALAICNEPAGPLPYAEAIRSDLMEVETVKREMSKGLPQGLDVLAKVTFVRLKTIKAGSDVDEGAKEKVKGYRELVKKSLKDMKDKLFDSQPFDYFVSQMPILLSSARQLERVTCLYMDTYMALKREKGVFDFNDLEHLTIALLNLPEVEAALKSRYEAVFVDEYQDTNAVQEYILSKVARSDNRFMVGDIKQSIYGFRLADPDIFLQKYKAFAEGGAGRRIDLSKNFRSRKEVLQGVNDLFDAIMTEQLGGVDYDEANRLYAGRTFETDAVDAVNLLILDKKALGASTMESDTEAVSLGDEEVTPSSNDMIDEDTSSLAMEAHAIGHEIRRLLHEGTVTDAETGESRKCRLGDMTILLRSVKSAKKVFEEVFGELGLPLVFDGTDGYFQTQEITIFMNVLRVLDNGLQDVPLLSALRSPIWQFTLEEMMQIRLHHMDGAFHLALESYKSAESGDWGDVDDTLKKKVNGYFDDIDRYRLDVHHMSLDRFIWNLMMETGYYDHMCAMPGGVEREANLRYLLDKAVAYEATGQSGLYGFINYLEKIETGASDQEGAKVVEDATNAVRLMSIHKSKGLEFPVVFLAKAAGRFNTRDLSQYLMTDKDLGIGLRYVDIKSRTFFESLPQIAMKLKARRAMLSEEMRILYVALTRAVEKLYVVGTVNSVEKAFENWSRGINPASLSRANCYMDWFGMLMADRCPDSIIMRVIADVAGLSGITEFSGREATEESISEGNQGTVETPRDDMHGGEVQGGDVQNGDVQLRFTKSFNWKAHWRHDRDKPYKMGVTGWLKMTENDGIENSDDGPVIHAPQETDGQDESASGRDEPADLEVTRRREEALAKGNAYHAVLQHLDFALVADGRFDEAYKSVVDKLIERGVMTVEGAAKVDSSKLRGFMESELGRALCSAEWVKREKSFVYRASGASEHLLQGVFDCYFKTDDGLVLVDYKTGGFAYRTDSDAIEAYGGQIGLYKEALSELTGLPVVGAWIVFVERAWSVAV